MIMAIVPVVLSWIRISDSHRKMDSCALPGISSGSIHIIMCLRTRRKMKMKLKKAMLLFAAAAVAAGTTSFLGVQPTGIEICERGRMSVWFPRRHDGVSCSVTEIFGGGFSERALCAGYEKSFEAGTAGRTPLPFTTAASVLPTPAFPRRRGRMAFPVDSIKLPL